MQLQIGLWLMTWHLVFTPHTPIHGSIHFRFEHALLLLQSEFTVHSGRHDGGTPKYPTIQEHTAWSLISLQWLFGPHGDGLQGWISIGAK